METRGIKRGWGDDENGCRGTWVWGRVGTNLALRPDGILEICPSALRKVGARGFLPIKETQGCHLYLRRAFLTSRAPT